MREIVIKKQLKNRIIENIKKFSIQYIIEQLEKYKDDKNILIYESANFITLTNENKNFFRENTLFKSPDVPRGKGIPLITIWDTTKYETKQNLLNVINSKLDATKENGKKIVLIDDIELITEGIRTYWCVVSNQVTENLLNDWIEFENQYLQENNKIIVKNEDLSSNLSEEVTTTIYNRRKDIIESYKSKLDENSTCPLCMKKIKYKHYIKNNECLQFLNKSCYDIDDFQIHHIEPLNEEVDNNTKRNKLDVESNLVHLCSNCHNITHKIYNNESEENVKMLKVFFRNHKQSML